MVEYSSYRTSNSATSEVRHITDDYADALNEFGSAFKTQFNIHSLSVDPAEGDRASLFSLTATSPEVAIYAWTPIKGAGQGRGWYDGYVTVTFVPVNTPAERCSVTDTKYNYVCRAVAKG